MRSCAGLRAYTDAFRMPFFWFSTKLVKTMEPSLFWSADTPATAILFGSKKLVIPRKDFSGNLLPARANEAGQKVHTAASASSTARRPVTV